MLKYLAIALLVLSGCTASKHRASNYQFNKTSFDENTLEQNKQRIKNNDAELIPAYQRLLAEADKALKEGPFSVMEKNKIPPSGDKHDYMSLAPYFWPDSSKPNGLPYVRKDGQTNPEVKEYLDKEYMPKMANLVQTLSLAYYFSNDEKYAKHAAKLLRVWFVDTATRMNPNLNFGQAIKGINEGRGAGLIDARHYHKIINGIGFLQASKHFTSSDNIGMKRWFTDYLQWLQTSKNGLDEMNARNNHGTWYDVQRLSIALLIDSSSLAKKVVENALNRLDNQMDEQGKFPREMERTISLHYSCFNMEAFFLIASMADKMGMNIWEHTTPKSNSIRKGFDFLKPYLTKQKEWFGQQIKPFDFEEDAFPLLLIAAKKYNCTDCNAAVKSLAGDKANRLRENLVY
jgi:hypothetical protein